MVSECDVASRKFFSFWKRARASLVRICFQNLLKVTPSAAWCMASNKSETHLAVRVLLGLEISDKGFGW